MQFHIRRDQRSGEFCISSCPCTTATDVLSDIVDLRYEDADAFVRWPYFHIYTLAQTRPTFSQFLSATIGPSVARVSAPRTIPSLNRHPTIVVPVLVAFGGLTPLFCRNEFLYARDSPDES